MTLIPRFTEIQMISTLVRFYAFTSINTTLHRLSLDLLENMNVSSITDFSQPRIKGDIAEQNQAEHHPQLSLLFPKLPEGLPIKS